MSINELMRELSMERPEDLYDVTIIGGGTTGLFASFYCGMRDLKTKVIEASSHLGGKVTQFFPEKYIYDIGGIPGITGDDLVKQAEKQAMKHNPSIITKQWIDHVIKKGDNTFELVTHNGAKHYTKAVIIATGMGSFNVVGPSLENADAYEHTSLHYSISNREKFAEKIVMISSNNRVGIEWALTLEKLADKVYLVNGEEAFQHASDEEVHRLSESSVEVIVEATIESLYGEKGLLTGVNYRDRGELKKLSVDHLCIYHGVKLNAAPFEQWDLTTEKGRVSVDLNMGTKIEGLFVAGDAAIYQGKTMLIGSGYTEAITAVNSAKKYIEPKSSAQVYSTVIYKNDK